MFLMTLRGGFQDYVINAALIYLHEQDAPAFLIERLMAHDGRQFADEDIWTDHLIAFGITGAKAVRLASEAAVAGSLDHHGLLQDAVIVSDGAGQFDVFRHGLCRVGGDVATPAPHRPERADFASLHLRCPAFGSSGESFAHSSVAMDNPGWR